MPFCKLFLDAIYALRDTDSWMLLRYCFIESFSLVFVEMYGFNLGENGLAYL